ncbi:hypothetical protein GQX74_015677, partial [Glossina fuscipes]
TLIRNVNSTSLTDMLLSVNSFISHDDIEAFVMEAVESSFKILEGLLSDFVLMAFHHSQRTVSNEPIMHSICNLNKLTLFDKASSNDADFVVAKIACSIRLALITT